MKNSILIYVLFFWVSFISAQEIIFISKSELLDKAIKNSYTLKISHEDFKVSKADYFQTNAVFLPNITASHTGISTTNPLMAFGSKLNQAILTQNDFNPNKLNNPARTQNFSTKLQIEQPLINLDGLYKRRAAKSKMEAMSLKAKRTKDFLFFEVTKAYMQLQLAYEAVTVLEKALQTAAANKKIADNSFKQGILLKADVLHVDINITEIKNQLQTAKSNVQNASNYLSFLMNDKSYVLYKPTEQLVVSNLEIYVEQISKNRSDIKAMQLASKSYEALSKAEKMSLLPKLNAFGSYELYDSKLFQGNASGYLVGAQLSWDIFNGSKQIGKIQKSKAQLEKSKLEYNQYVSKSNLEFYKVKRYLTDIKNKLELTDLAVKQSKESLRIRQNRFKEGLEKTADLLLAETQLLQKQLTYYQTIFEYNFTHAYLQFLTKE